MPFIVICFLLITGSWAMDSEMDEEEEIPLLCDHFFDQNSLEHLNDSSFPLTDLPDDLFWPVIFDCKDSIVSLSGVSRALYKRIGELIPTFVLPRFPSSRNILDVLTVIEKCELKYKSLSKITLGIEYFPKYQKEIERLCACEPYVRYSPLFWWYGGSDRIETLHSIHEEEPSELSDIPIDQLRRYCSSIVRDPIVLGIATTATLAVTGIIFWQTKIINDQYNAVFQNNLNYTYSLDFLENYEGSKYWQAYNCFSSKSRFGCFNISHYCLEGNSPLSNITELSNIIWEMIPTKLLPANFNIMSMLDIQVIVADIFNKVCSIDHGHTYRSWSKHINRIIPNGTILIQNDIQNNNQTFWMCKDMYKGQNLGFFATSVINYDPLCIAKYVTLMPIGLPISGIVSIAINIIFWGIFLLGWGISL